MHEDVMLAVGLRSRSADYVTYLSFLLVVGSCVESALVGSPCEYGAAEVWEAVQTEEGKRRVCIQL